MIRQLIIPLATSAAVSLSCLALGYWIVKSELATRPPIAVVDYEAIGNALALGVPAQEIQPYLEAIKKRAQAYEAAGYVVINAASVDAAPPDVFVPPLQDLPEAWMNGAPQASNGSSLKPNMKRDGEP